MNALTEKKKSNRFGVRVFDTVLSSKNIVDSVSRNSSAFWREFCYASAWDFSYERVHSIADLKHLLGRVIKENIMIFSGHGSPDAWHLTNGEELTPKTAKEIRVHPKNFGKTIIFSSCYMAKNTKQCQEFRDVFRARELLTYYELMYDQYCFLNESILLTLMHKNKNRAISQFDFVKFKSLTDFMKTLNKKGAKRHPMEIFTAK